MRLFRRTLLCLVVGVTAFGAAGWGLRPRATWSVALPGGRYYEFPLGGSPIDDYDPLWLVVTPDEHHLEEDKEVLAVDAMTGVAIRRFAQPKAEKEEYYFYTLPNGRLLADLSDSDSTPRQTRFQLFDAARDQPDPVITLDGAWRIGDGGSYAWRFDTSKDSHGLFERRDFRGGAPSRRATIDRKFKDDDGVAYSPEANLLAVPQERLDGAEPPFGIELFDATTGKLLRTIPAPADGDGLAIESLYFVNRGRSLFLHPRSEPNTKRSVVVDVERGTVRESVSFTPPAAPAEASGVADLAWDRDNDWSGQAWVLNQLDPAAAWVTLITPEAKSIEWRRLPYLPIIERSPNMFSDKLSDRLMGVRPYRVPGSSQVVLETKEVPWGESLPAPLRSRLPYHWGALWNTRLRWHDWGSGSWRDAGGPSDMTYVQVRAHAALTIEYHEDENMVLLQSWPLPPRDPKPPALAIAALCMAGTWWVCAWRYRRRTRLASVGAA